MIANTTSAIPAAATGYLQEPTVSQTVAVSQANACVCRVPKSVCLISSFKQHHNRPVLDFKAFGVEKARTRCSDFHAWLGAPSPHPENKTRTFQWL